MDRKPSFTSDGATARQSQYTDHPPWENRATIQVPYLGRSSPPPTATAEPRVSACTRYARSSSQPNGRPRLTTTASAPVQTEWISPVSEVDTSERWRVSTYACVQPPPAPYETPVFIPAGPRGSYHPPPPSSRSNNFSTHMPPSPPGTDSCSSTKSATPPPRDPHRALSDAAAGVAHAQNDALRGRIRSIPQDQPTKTSNKRDSLGAGRRFKTALKGMFRKEPVDESQLQHISNRHWADDEDSS